MVFTAYACDDFKMNEEGVLTIFGSFAEFTSNISKVVEGFIDRSMYPAVVCPQLYVNSKGVKVSKVIFR